MPKTSNNDRISGEEDPSVDLSNYYLTSDADFTEGMAAMKHEAKFSVILPAGSFKSSQTEAFEQAVQHYSIPAKLPLYTDSKGNYVVSSGLCLRDAQLLRRQVSGCGYPADVVSDSAEAAASAKASELNELKSELSNVNIDSLNIDSDLPSDAWGSMELPSSLDLGLNDGEDLDKKSDWSGENWLSPDMSEHTLSVSAEVLLQKAKESAVDLPVVTAKENEAAQKNKSILKTPLAKSDSKGLPKLGLLKPAAIASKATADTKEKDDVKETADSKASADTPKPEEIKAEAVPANDSAEVKAEAVPANDSAEVKAITGTRDTSDADKDEMKAQKKADQQSTQTASFSPPPEILLQAASEPLQKKEEDASAKLSDEKLPETSAGKHAETSVKSKAADTTNSSASNTLPKSQAPETAAMETAEQKSLPTDTIMMVTLAAVVICLILALISAFVSPITPLVSPLF